MRSTRIRSLYMGLVVPVVLGALLAPRAAEADNATQVAAGGNHTCAVTSAGAVLCWGWNDSGRLGDGTATRLRPTPAPVKGEISGVVAVTAGEAHSCALTSAGAVWCWGYNYYGQLGRGPSWTDGSTPAPVPWTHERRGGGGRRTLPHVRGDEWRSGLVLGLQRLRPTR